MRCRPEHPKTRYGEREREREGSTYPPLNLPSVRQATSRERPAPMIKLVGFNISGIPKRTNRKRSAERRTKTGESAKMRDGKEKGGSRMKQRSALSKRVKTKGGLAKKRYNSCYTTKEENDRVIRIARRGRGRARSEGTPGVMCFDITWVRVSLHLASGPPCAVRTSKSPAPSKR